MSFIRVGNIILNVMAVSLALYDLETEQLLVHVVGVPEPLTLEGDLARELADALAFMATPLARLKRA